MNLFDMRKRDRELQEMSKMMLDISKKKDLIEILDELDLFKDIEVYFTIPKKVEEANLSTLPFSDSAFNVLNTYCLRNNLDFTVKSILPLITGDNWKHLRSVGKKKICNIKSVVLLACFNAYTDEQKQDFFYYLLDRNFD